MDAITMLRDDHKQVEVLFKRIEKGDLAVVPDVCRALTVHAALEEEVFYPTVRAEVDDSDDVVLESVEEHRLVKRLVAELESGDPRSEEYGAKATVLVELVRHHVEEEEDELFPEVRATMGRKRLQELGATMRELREKVEGREARSA